MREQGREWNRLLKIPKKVMEEEVIAKKSDAMQAKTARLHELLKIHIQDLNATEENLAFV